ncbi:MAG: DEAD/DEAH box helicase [Hyphomicrobiales bacterium]|nr:DEAD/DEAH box helicase [Hyphomicrobiales bacterium]MCP5371986.1 DEAD/DEAH box helicase [Hyphomicrobiales bacterium]
MTDFTGLELAQPLLRAIADEGYTTPTPIQVKSIPPLLEGRDLLGVAQTGTGKTASFALPLLHRLAAAGGKAQRNRPRALILAPTRELAGQIGDSLRTYGRHLPLKSAVVFGGVSIRPQIQALARGVHVLVATPGRLIDLMNQGHARLDAVEVFILDEADRMLDMGFVRDVKKIAAAVPAQRQTVLFSATMPKAVQGLADGLLERPVRVEAAPQATTAERIDQKVLFVAKEKKRALLGELLNNDDIARVLIFTRTKHGADRVARHLHQSGIEADAIHGNKAQNARQRALQGFRDGRIRALVATDIAARGIDVDGVTHVINFELPNDPESYVHRIGRTARAGAAGMAISFCDHGERAYLRDIERIIRRRVDVIHDHPYHVAEIVDGPAAQDPAPKRPARSGPRPPSNGKPGGGGRRRNRRRGGGADRRAA